ncbi:MAG: hypothetical protein RLZ97_868, partial [Verrucomicrobiota bacterium]
RPEGAHGMLLTKLGADLYRSGLGRLIRIAQPR